MGHGFRCESPVPSKEIHRLGNKHINCQTERISNREFVSKRKALKLISEEGYSGCCWCFNV